MDNLIKAVGILCVTSYVIGILFNLVNLNYTRKAVRLTAALYIISSVVIPLKNIDFDMDISVIQQESISYNSTEYIISAAEGEMENTIKALLDEKNLSYTQLKVHIHKQSEGLAVDCIEIYGTQQNSRELISRLLSEYGTVIYGD